MIKKLKPNILFPLQVASLLFMVFKKSQRPPIKIHKIRHSNTSFELLTSTIKGFSKHTDYCFLPSYYPLSQKWMVSPFCLRYHALHKQDILESDLNDTSGRLKFMIKEITVQASREEAIKNSIQLLNLFTYMYEHHHMITLRYSSDTHSFVVF